MDLLKELDETIRVLEAKIPANPASAANRKLERKLRKEMERYFKSLELAMPTKEIERIYKSYVEVE